jgi:hypothetical protein
MHISTVQIYAVHGFAAMATCFLETSFMLAVCPILVTVACVQASQKEQRVQGKGYRGHVNIIFRARPWAMVEVSQHVLIDAWLITVHDMIVILVLVLYSYHAYGVLESCEVLEYVQRV